MSPSRAVIVGASLAGLRAAEALRHRGHDGPITIVGAETHPPYDRPPLSKRVLAGIAGLDATELHTAAGLDADWRLGTRAVGLDLTGRLILVEGDDAGRPERLRFDLAVIATGAAARRWPGDAPPGVHVLRTLDDAVGLGAALDAGGRVVIVGAGFIGLEVAASCRFRGLEVTVVEPLEAPVVRAVGPEIGRRMGALHRANDVELRLGTGVAGFTGTAHVEGVVLDDATVLPADVVVVGIGATPATGWLQGSGVDLGDGVVCDERLRVLSAGRPVPGLVAAGDVARWHHPGWGQDVRIEHWTHAAESAAAAVATLLDGDAAPAFTPVPYVWSDQYGRKLQVMGRVSPGDDMVMLEDDVDAGRFVAAFGRHGRLTAGVGLGRPAKVAALGRRVAAGDAFPPGP